MLYAVHIGLLVASEIWPVHPGSQAIDGPAISAILAGMVGTIVAGLALAQVLVATYKVASNQRESRG